MLILIRPLNIPGSTATYSFTAALSSTKAPIGPRQTIIYDHVVTNSGQCFDHFTGVFKACVAGNYVFSVSVQSTSTHSIVVEIVHNGALLCSAINNDGKLFGQGGCLAVVSLRRGDDVWVRHVTGDYMNGGYYNVFTGFLVRSG